MMFNDSLTIYTMKQTNKQKKLKDGVIVASGNLIPILRLLSFHE